MSERVLNNFRGTRALVLHPDDSNRDMLKKTLRRLGLFVAVAAPEPVTLLTPEVTACDVLFCDADRPLGATFGDQPVPEVPHIALIGMEAPSRLARVVRQRCCGYLLKPVRSAGVFTALFMAFNEFALRQREASERNELIERIHGRRHVIKAVLHLIAKDGIDDDEAFRRLRRESMRRRVPIERIAKELIEADECALDSRGSRIARSL